MDLNISLEQGKQFKKLQKNIDKKKPVITNNKPILKEAFTNNINKVNQQDIISEIQVLQKQFDTLMSQYVSLKNNTLTQDKNLIKRTDSKSNKFLNNNIQLTDGTKGYVNNSGVVKWYGTEDLYNSTAGKNGCPSNNNILSVNFAQSAEYQTPGANIPVEPALKVGTYMLNGQGCGNEGKNVFVSKMINSNKSTNIGCYNNTNSDALLKTDLTNTTFEKCKQYAISNAYKLFGLGDYNTTNNIGTCYVGNDKTKATQYVDAKNINTPVAIWTSNTNGKGVSFLTISTEGSIQLCGTDGSIIYETIKDSTCTKSYSISKQTDVNGNDISHLTNTTLSKCQQACYDNPQCSGFTLNNSTNSECWLKSNTNKTTSGSGKDLYSRLPKKSNMSNCVFFLTLQADGNLCIYRGTSPQNNKGGGAIWCTMTNGKQQQANTNWLSSKGKYGKSFLTSGQTLSLGEWIGSDDGKMRLILQEDGNLVLYTSTNSPGCITNTKDNMIYGAQGVLSVYELDNVGIKDNIGKVGYVDEDSNLREYPNSMIGTSNDYIMYQNMNLLGQSPLVTSNTTSVEDCQQQCSNNNDCKAYTFQQGSNVCYQYGDINKSNSTIMPTDGITLGQRRPKLLNDASCGLDYTEIDTNQWQTYNKGEQMSSTTKCGYALINEDNQKKLEEVKKQIVDVSNKLIEKTEQVANSNQKINQNLNVDKDRLKQRLQYYNNIKNKIQNEPKTNIESFLNMNDVTAMLGDSNINVLSANYNYILWSIFALGLATITLKHINK